MTSSTTKIKLAASAALVIMGLLTGDAIALLKQPPTTYGTAIDKLTSSEAPDASTTSFTVSPPSGSGTGGQTAVSTSDTTSNWAGYVSTGGTYTSVSGSWDVPTVTPSNDTIAADASWIGIGGDTSDDLIQVGTQNVVQDGQVTTGTFYERLPGTSETVPGVTASAGDSIAASIKEVSPGEWSITIDDLTNGESYSNTVAYNSSESSAEWVEEAPSTGSSIIPLDSFGSVTFTGGSTTENGTALSIAGSDAQVLTMDSEAGQALTSTSALSSSGSSFTVTRTDASSNDNLYGSNQQYEPTPGGWARHEPGRSMWGQGWGSQETQPYGFTNY